MNPSNVRYGERGELHLRFAGSPTAVPAVNSGVRLVASGTQAIVAWSNGQELCDPAEAPDSEKLASGLPFSESVVAYIIDIHEKERRLSIGLRSFERQIVEDGRMHLGLTDLAVSLVARKMGGGVHTGNVQSACEWLKDDLLFASADGRPTCVVTAGPGAKVDDAFRILGNKLAADVATTLGKWFVQRVLDAPPKGKVHSPVALLTGDLAFVDATAAAAIRAASAGQLAALREDPFSYQNTWRLYQAKEKEHLQRAVAAFGWVKYSGYTATDPDDERVLAFQLDHWTREDMNRFKEVSHELAISQSLPDEVQHPHLIGDTTARQGTGRQGQQDDATATYQGTGPHGPILRLHEDCEVRPGPTGYIFVSWIGDQTRLRRRDEAATGIAQGAVPMANLALLLGDLPTSGHARPPLRLSDRELVRMFGGRVPNDRQREAFYAILNTPNIAVVQGPPGTGKTSVISAVMRYVGEHVIDASRASARVLVTSYQHDAVNKAASGTFIHGLPAMKVGSKEAGLAGGDPVELWRQSLLEQLDQKLSRMPGNRPQISEAAAECYPLAYQRLDHAGFLATVGRFLAVAAPEIGPVAAERIRERARAVSAKSAALASKSNRTAWRRAAWCIHPSAEAFADGGADQCRFALQVLGKTPLLNQNARELLTTAAAWQHQGRSPTFLHELKLLRDQLLDALRPGVDPADGLIAPDDEINAMIDAALAEWRQRENRRPATLRGVAARLRADLQDAGEAERLVLRYSAVFAATCQQAAGRTMQLTHELSTGDSAVTFDTVIVDEAARANPLDLQIPMALASQRIALVGDHRQLPHMLEPDVERELRQDLTTLQEEALQQSLFERLFRQLDARDRENLGGAAARVVTLDTQYRMHPVLGDLVSHCFYERHEESVRLKSGKPIAEFGHNVKKFSKNGTSVCAAWSSVPLSKSDGEHRSGTSWSRSAEAVRIADHVRSVFTEQKELSIGVISFYQAQVNTIWDQLVKKRLARHDGNTTRPVEGLKLQVGTVDSFQGLEFDVVFLSMTRSNARPATTPNDCRQKYGHLCVENRLCVSMSRAMRLLVVVGDPAMVSPPQAEGCIYGLVKFWQLCATQANEEGCHGILV